MIPDAKSLFNLKRFHPFSGLAYFMFFLYMPLGIVLFTLRLLISFQYLLIIGLLPKAWLIRRILTRIFLFFLGIFISSTGSHHKKKEAKVIISNHISLMDIISIEAIWPVKQFIDSPEIPQWVSWLLNLQLSQKECEHGSVYPQLFFPEKTTSNGNVGLLRFSAELFEDIQEIIQPLVMTVNRPWFAPVYVNCLDSTFTSDLLWSLYCPFTHYTICYLPVREIPKEEQQLEDFVKALQKDMAYVLDKQATSVTSLDKLELIKRLKDDKRKEQERLAASLNNHPANKPSASFLSATQRKSQLDTIQMIEQVKNVLPQVPVKIIQKELELMKNVDSTLSHLLDGTIIYTPLTHEDQLKEKKLIAEKKKSISNKGNSSTFSNNWKDRHFSFQEKKRLMIEEARQKYLKLHPEYD